ncbi:MAG: flagella basal body P-ring formation protein FlgA [Deltaproteobacteria bacterium]|nr:MAG: flagella basal body P-ring formation protein FlgA [Deltaproteobacteria bacterium]
MRLLPLILLILCLPSQLLALEIRWRDTAKIRGDQITLVDLADIRADRATAAYLASVGFGPAPLPGRDISIDSRDARQRLLNTYPQLLGANFTGSSTIRIHRSGMLIDAARIKNLVRRKLEELARNMPNVRISLKQIQAPNDLILPEGKLRTAVRPLGTDLLRCRSVVIDFSIDGHLERRLTVPVAIRATARVVAASRDLPRGTILGKRDLTLVERELATLSGPVYKPASLVGKKLKRAVRRAQALSNDMVTVPPVIKRGEPVTIALASGPVRVEARGIARRDGRPGETIPVSNISSRKTVLCRVTGPGTVQVEY